MRAEALDPVLLRTFVAVADLGSFTAAATAEGYTQSAVSRQVAALEDVCAEGFGVTLVPALAESALAREGVALRAVASGRPRRAVYAAVGRHARRSPAVTAFLADLRDAAGELRG
ncbi:LysR family transcriptional regulator [Actinomadura sp. GTD37]|uniref:LysR family transcriptional regulator n=1 Tax=Actinomadura sp. GTD37 TaxID=1778030 RepID=UPI0035BF8C5E